MFTAALFLKPRHRNNSSAQKDKIFGLRSCGTHTHTHKYYSAMKKNEILPFVATWMDLENIILNEVRQKDKYYMTEFTCRN